MKENDTTTNDKNCINDNYDKFISFFSKTTNRNSMKIYHIDDQDTVTEDGDPIEDARDFEMYFDDDIIDDNNDA